MDAQRLTRQFQAMARMAELLNSDRPVDALLSDILELAMNAVGAERGFIMLAEADGSLQRRIQRNLDGEPGLSNTILQNVYTRRKHFFSLDASADEYLQDAPSVREFGLRTAMAVPLVVQERCLGVIYLDNRVRSGAFYEEDLQFVQAFSHHAAVALDRSILSELRNEFVVALQESRRDAAGQLAAGLAHELNNPLGVILVNAQMAVDAAASDEERESLQHIAEGVRRCRSVLDRLLQYYRTGTAGEVVRTDMARLLEDVAAFHREALEQAGAGLKLECPPLEVWAPRQDLNQVLNALTRNAVQAVAAAGRPGLVTLSASDADDRVQIEVRDTGVGMPQEVLARCFDPFFTTRPVGSGQGLGLSVALGLARHHGGDIQAVSSPGRGSTFRVVWPKHSP